MVLISADEKFVGVAYPIIVLAYYISHVVRAYSHMADHMTTTHTIGVT